MNYEEKYKQALERAKERYSACSAPALIEYIFPEIKGNEDEQIKKRLIKTFGSMVKEQWGGIAIEDILAWLDKQGEQTHAEHGQPEVTKTGDQELEPMFNEGDWVVYDHRPYQVVELPKEGYINLGLRRNGKVEFAPSPYCRHWSIQDAEDGDVLASELTGSIFLFRGIKDNKIDFYCDYDTELEWPEHRFGINDTDQHYGSVEESQDIHPATKEQRDLLFTNMKEAGWEWDNEKKELKKFEPKFNVDDWIVTDDSFGKIVRHIDDINLINKEYIVSDENGLRYNNISFDSEHKWHKWTIQDAEDGDVLASELTDFIFLFRGIKDNKIDFYCSYDTRLEWPEPEPDDRFVIKDTNQYYGRVEKSQDIHPATKGQRDLLFEKMKEEGYEWDGEKKELKKIKSKKLDPDKVIEWLRKNTCTGCWGDKADTAISQRIDRFKKDFRL